MPKHIPPANIMFPKTKKATKADAYQKRWKTRTSLETVQKKISRATPIQSRRVLYMLYLQQMGRSPRHNPRS